jgi:hypothetical protein
MGRASTSLRSFLGRVQSGRADINAAAAQRTLKLTKELLIVRGCAAHSYMFLCSLANALHRNRRCRESRP